LLYHNKQKRNISPLPQIASRIVCKKKLILVCPTSAALDRLRSQSVSQQTSIKTTILTRSRFLM